MPSITISKEESDAAKMIVAAIKDGSSTPLIVANFLYTMDKHSDRIIIALYGLTGNTNESADVVVGAIKVIQYYHEVKSAPMYAK